MKQRLVKILGIALIIISLISAGVFINHQLILNKEKIKFDNLSRERDTYIANREEGVKSLDSDSKKEVEGDESDDYEGFEQTWFTKMATANSDLLAWLTFESLGIDYPLMYTPDNQNYYLHRDFDGQYSKSGTPFIDVRTPLDDIESKISIIYGHNMKNETMFSGLTKLNSADKIDDCCDILLEKQDGMLRYKPYAVIKLKEYSSYADYFYTQTGYETEEEFLKYINFIEKNGVCSSKVKAEYGAEFLVLSTCSYHVTGGRFVLIAIKK